MNIENAVTLYIKSRKGISSKGAICLCLIMVRLYLFIPNKTSAVFPGSDGGS